MMKPGRLFSSCLLFVCLFVSAFLSENTSDSENILPMPTDLQASVVAETVPIMLPAAAGAVSALSFLATTYFLLRIDRTAYVNLVVAFLLGSLPSLLDSRSRMAGLLLLFCPINVASLIVALFLRFQRSLIFSVWNNVFPSGVLTQV